MSASSPVSPSLVWFRLDLRLADQPALTAALRRGGPVIPVFIWAPEEEAPWEPGAASRWWLHHSLARLAGALEERGSRLIVRRGPTLETLEQLVTETGAGAVFWNRRYEPRLTTRDRALKERLRGRGLVAESTNSALLHEPWTVQNQSGRPFQVFTPYWRHCLTKADPPPPLPAPAALPAPTRWPRSVSIDSLELLPRLPWDAGFGKVWTPGEAGGQTRLERWVAGGVGNYGDLRNRPDLEGTSRLSPHLHFGEISPRQVWEAVKRTSGGGEAWRSSVFLTEIGWREFAHHLLHHFPETPDQPLRAEFARFPWRRSAALWKAWTRGRTGFPLVDAGMRQLWTTGWMHNRVRMVVGSFLVKDLLISWQEGARWFWDTLVDADLASNTLGWQWVSGCGADAAPYFRVFNPTSQGEKFDPDGHYVRQWVPELARLEADAIHDPAAQEPLALRQAGVTLGVTYPHPVVDHGEARKQALAALATLRAPA